VARNAPLAVRQAKQALDAAADVALAAGLEIEQKAYEPLLQTRDRVEGLQAFAEKRPPVYRGE
jgi:enoyl-CoA hydratase/carnithine racemase